MASVTMPIRVFAMSATALWKSCCFFLSLNIFLPKNGIKVIAKCFLIDTKWSWTTAFTHLILYSFFACAHTNLGLRIHHQPIINGAKNRYTDLRHNGIVIVGG
jgi:hypothetical protein